MIIDKVSYSHFYFVRTYYAILMVETVLLYVSLYIGSAKIICHNIIIHNIIIILEYIAEMTIQRVYKGVSNNNKLITMTSVDLV